MKWINEFDRRLRDFESGLPGESGEFPVSIKVKVDSGCYDRGCCPAAYEIIDRELETLRRAGETRFRFEKHESGPEILAYIGGAVGLRLLSSAWLPPSFRLGRKAGKKGTDTVTQ